MATTYQDFREFYAARAKALSRAAFFLTVDDVAAEELLQEAMVRTLAKWRSRRLREGNAEAYVRQVMLNIVGSRWRHASQYPEEQLGVQRVVNPARSEDATVDRDSLGQALRLLGPRQRAVLYLRFYLDWSEAETARSIGCSVGTVKSQTHDALVRLRQVAPWLAEVDEPQEVGE